MVLQHVLLSGHSETLSGHFTINGGGCVESISAVVSSSSEVSDSEDGGVPLLQSPRGRRIKEWIVDGIGFIG